jgi:tetratricopeptide (TPR) repeat protein
MTDLSEMFALEPEIGRLPLTDGSIALLNLQAQIDGIEGHDTFAAALIDLLILRGLILGRISDYERAAQLANRRVGVATTDAAAYLARARTRTVFHRFAEALDDLDRADRLAPNDAAAKRERAAILQAQGRFDEALSTYSAVIDSVGQFERAAALPACGPSAAKSIGHSAFTSMACAVTGASLRFRWHCSSFSLASCG